MTTRRDPTVNPLHPDSDGTDIWDHESQLSHVDDNATYVCNHCGEEIVIPIDLAGGEVQTYVEDCPVCCSPSVIHVHLDDEHVDVRAESEQD